MAALIGVILFGRVFGDLRYQTMTEPGFDLRSMLRQVGLFVPIPAILWYDSLHPNVGLKILAGTIALIGVWDWGRLWKCLRKVGARQGKKRISYEKGADGVSVVIDQRRDGGYTAWSTDDDDLKVEAPTLRGIDDEVRRYVRDRLVDGERQDLRLAYVWEDSQPATSTADGSERHDRVKRPPKSLYFDVQELPGEGYVAVSEPAELRVAAENLEGLAPAARSEIARRWPYARAPEMPRVTFGWVRTIQV